MTNATQLLDDYRKKSGKLKSYLADKLGVCRGTFATKWNNPSLFTLQQTKIICDELEIPQEDMMVIFFGFLVE